MKSSVLFFFFLFIAAGWVNAADILSPDKNIKVVLEFRNSEVDQESGSLWYKVLYKTIDSDFIEVLPFSRLGIKRMDAEFVYGLELIQEGDSHLIKNSYEMKHGKRRYCDNTGTKKILYLKNAEGHRLNVTFLVYNNGVAFRYSFPEVNPEPVRIIDEATTFFIPDGTKRWMQAYTHANEDYYPLAVNGKSPKPACEWGFPALYQVKDQDVFVLLSEANMGRNNCGTRLSNKQDSEIYRVVMADSYPNKAPLKELSKEYNSTGAYASLPWDSQWRVLMIGRLSDIVESTLITDLSEPSKISDDSWINPGVSSWDWWFNNTGPRDFREIKEYIDLAAEMDWSYMLVDAGWDSIVNGGAIEDIVKYAAKKNIGIMVWYNSSTIPTIKYRPKNRLLSANDREKEFSWLKSMGVVGIKVDFFAGDQQDIMNYYINIFEDAAKYNLLVNCHGATIPRGWSRTYPNLMTMEAVVGAEMYGFWESLGQKARWHNTIVPFNRNVIGPMDYTPVTFSNLRYSHPTTYAHELALSVVFESGIQHFADTPDQYLNLPDGPKEFLHGMPVAWDDTRLIDGYPGEKAVFARKKDDKWYIGGISGADSTCILSVNFDFLDKGKYDLKLIQDGESSTEFKTRVIKIRENSIIKIKCLPGGGFAGTITKK